MVISKDSSKEEQNWVQENDFWTLTSEENRMKNVRKNDIIIAITEVSNIQSSVTSPKSKMVVENNTVWKEEKRQQWFWIPLPDWFL